MENRFRKGDIVQHFKRELLSPEEKKTNKYLYEIVGVATHSETREPMMVYMPLYDDGGMYVRPLDMFLSEVDREKYPEVQQKYRFEKVQEVRGRMSRGTMKQYIVDAFTSEPFSGNPAAVCVMDSWPAEASMMNLAMENNLSETAFIVKEEQGYHLRWFTPATEVELCGHATLASAFVILNYYEPESDEVCFSTLSGLLTVRRRGSLYEMDFPTYELREIPVTDDMERAFGVRPVKAILGMDLICVFENEEQVRNMKPDQEMLQKIEGRLQNATAAGTESDCVSRSFAPKLAIAEDPVCGSAHCQIADYWSAESGKTKIHAYQASKRGGHLYCEMLGGGRISISGEAALVAISEVVAEL